MNLSTITPAFQISHSMTVLYIAVILAAIGAITLILKRWGKSVGTYLLAKVLYTTVAIASAVIMARGPLHVLLLLAYGVFPGGLIFVALSAYISLKNGFKLLAGFDALLAVFIIAVGIDAFLVEPNWLEISRYEIKSNKISAPLKIAIIADLQTDSVGDYEKSVFVHVQQEKPDMVILPGDYLQCASLEELSEQSRRLKELLRDTISGAALGIYALQGDVERLTDDNQPWWTNLFSDVNAKTFTSTETTDCGPLVITGLTLADSAKADMRVAAQKKFHIVTGHRPEFALARPDADLLIAGHTHGGQVQLPGVGPLLTFSKVPLDWAKGGLTRIDADTTLIVSRGIGMERWLAPRIRFCCRPQLIYVELKPDR